MGYDYEIFYRPRHDNFAIDALSYKPNSPTLNYVFVPQVQLWEDIKRASQEDAYIGQVGQIAKEKPEGPYKLREGLAFLKNKVVVPHIQELHKKILGEFHDSKPTGNSGVLRTYKRLAQQLYWPKMYQDVQGYVAACEVCQKTKS